MQLEKKGLKHVCEQRDWSRERVLLEEETNDKYLPQSFVSVHDSLTRETLSIYVYHELLRLTSLFRSPVKKQWLSSLFAKFFNNALYSFIIKK